MRDRKLTQRKPQMLTGGGPPEVNVSRVDVAAILGRVNNDRELEELRWNWRERRGRNRGNGPRRRRIAKRRSK